MFEEINRLALEQIDKWGGPSLNHYNLSMQKGQELAKKLNANVDIVKKGIALMDIKLGECFKLGIQGEHVEKSAKYTEEILNKLNASKQEMKILLNCVRAHHGKEKFSSIEAEIVANADCYRFIHPSGVLTYISTLTKRGLSQNEIINGTLKKLEEKYEIFQ